MARPAGSSRSLARRTTPASNRAIKSSIAASGPGSAGSGQPVAGYQAAFSGLILLKILALLWFCLLAQKLSAERHQGRQVF